MIVRILIAGFLLLGNSIFAQSPDQNWWNNLNDNRKKTVKVTTNPSVAQLQKILNLTELGYRESQIKNLSPLQKPTNLTTLNCEKNNIIDLSPFQSLTNLTILNCHENRITDLSPLQNLSKLAMQKR